MTWLEMSPIPGLCCPAVRAMTAQRRLHHYGYPCTPSRWRQLFASAHGDAVKEENKTAAERIEIRAHQDGQWRLSGPRGMIDA